MSSSSQNVDLLNIGKKKVMVVPHHSPLVKKTTSLKNVVHDFNLEFFNERYTVPHIKKQFCVKNRCTKVPRTKKAMILHCVKNADTCSKGGPRARVVINSQTDLKNEKNLIKIRNKGRKFVTVDTLKNICRANGIKNYSGKRKDELYTKCLLNPLGQIGSKKASSKHKSKKVSWVIPGLPSDKDLFVPKTSLEKIADTIIEKRKTVTKAKRDVKKIGKLSVIKQDKAGIKRRHAKDIKKYRKNNPLKIKRVGTSAKVSKRIVATI